MCFEDNFFEPSPGHLFDLKLRLQLRAVPGPEAPANTAGLILFYYPELRADDFEPLVAGEVSFQEVLESISSRGVQSIVSGRIWLELVTTSDQLIINVQDTASIFEYLEREIGSLNIPEVSAHPKEALLYCLRALVKLTTIKPRYGLDAISHGTRKIEARISRDLAANFFKLHSSEYEEAADGSACIAFREIAH